MNSKISIEISKNFDTLELNVECSIEGSKMDIIEAFLKVLNDKEPNELQDVIEAVKNFNN
jgi:hypothetical protein